MAGVALDGYTLAQSKKSSHVNYTERYVYGYDQWGRPLYTTDSYNSDAKIDGTVKASSSTHVKVNGVSVLVQSDQTTETWVADPDPYPHRGGTIISVSPGRSGSGSGTVQNSNCHVFINGQPIALNGTAVTTSLGNSTTINQGSDFVFVI
ncbi:hypothetical protein [Paenibacillus elgii]|uniref:hypothetical protein n=1 Tax=Paenibacillus elgii TaxID=189691 RepID=UPI00203FAEB5|nr:hypothetical protein [Paenibacillus elgii]MCM3271150.1 hypothetical protein [Paenibacillus elgii]